MAKQRLLEKNKRRDDCARLLVTEKKAQKAQRVLKEAQKVNINVNLNINLNRNLNIKVNLNVC